MLKIYKGILKESEDLQAEYPDTPIPGYYEVRFWAKGKLNNTIPGEALREESIMTEKEKSLKESMANIS